MQCRQTSMGSCSRELTTGLFSNQCRKFEREIDVANTLLARDYKGFGNQPMNGVICGELDNQISSHPAEG